jgi:antitoxin (DNA-binding transcriptional repressor) of toxin-antitoxin stability system
LPQKVALKLEKEILITRDSKPVAKLVRVAPEPPRRKSWDAQKHRRRINELLGGRVFPGSASRLDEARTDRQL